MEKTKVNCSLKTLNYFPYEGYGRVMELFNKYLEFNQDSPNQLVLAYPHEVAKRKGGRVVFYTMFEADKIPDEWLEPLSKADAIIVPNEWNKKVFYNSGVRVPISIVPLGTDNFEEYFIPDKEFTFLHYDFTSYKFRKGGDLVLEAFIGVFSNVKNVKLILKGQKHYLPNLKKYQNVEYILEPMNREQLEHLLMKTHCFVFPSRGEGFGLPPVEAMAHGIPTILTNGHSMKEFAGLGIPLETVGDTFSYYDNWTTEGCWVEPDPNQLKDLMERVYHNYRREKERALENRKVIEERYNFTKIAEKLATMLNLLFPDDTREPDGKKEPL